MKIVCSLFLVAFAASACGESKKNPEAAAALKSDTTFVVQPELPAEAPVANETPREETKMEKPPTTRKAANKQTAASSQQTQETAAANGAGTSEGAEETKKKGWSKTAKGAVVGGVVGAGTGAIVNKKNRAAGAVIGGVIGAGAGAVIGNEMDKKDGRH